MPDHNDDDGGSFEDSPSSSFRHNPWPYASPSQQLQLQNRYFEDGATIHFDRLRGLPFWAPIFFFPDEIRVRLILRRVLGASQNAQRRLTAEEANALSEHADSASRKLSWAHPASVAAAAAAAANGRKTFKFPFFQPKMQFFNPYYFPTRSMPMLKGPTAAFQWHIVRFSCYIPLTWVASIVFFSSVSDMSYQAHILRDSRLTALVKDIQQSAAKVSQKLLRQTQSGTKSGEDLQRQMQRRQMGLPEPSGGSPQGQANYSSSQVPPPSYPQPYPQSQAVGNDTAPAPQDTQWGASQAPPQKYGESTPPNPPSANANWDSDPFEDDASPVAPSARRAEAAQNQSGSAWARLRQKSQSDASSFAKGDSSGQERGWGKLRQDKAPNTTDGTRSTEQYSYSPQDEEREKRNYEKEQAQKEFDALLEAERRGESSSSRRR